MDEGDAPPNILLLPGFSNINGISVISLEKKKRSYPLSENGTDPRMMLMDKDRMERGLVC